MRFPPLLLLYLLCATVLRAGDADAAHAAWRTELQAAWDAMVVKPWRAQGRQDAWGADGETLVTNLPSSLAVDRRRVDLLQKPAIALLQAQCDDPVLVALALQEPTDARKLDMSNASVPAATRAWAAVDPVATPVLARVWLLAALAPTKPDLGPALTAIIAEALAPAALAEPQGRAKRLLTVYALGMLMVSPSPHLVAIEAGLDRPGLDPWSVQYLKGVLALRQVIMLHRRGGLTAMPAEERQRYTAGLMRARQHLEAAWKLRDDLPNPAVQMILIGLDDPEVDPAVWFDRAIAVHPRFLLAWEHGMQICLRDNDVGRLLAFARRAAETAPDGTLFGRIAWPALYHAVSVDPAQTWRHPDTWPLASRIAADTIAGETSPWRRAMRLIIAFNGGQQAECDRIYDQAGGLEGRGLDLSDVFADMNARYVLASIEQRRNGSGDWSPRPFPGRGVGIPRWRDAPRLASCLDDLPDHYQQHGAKGTWDADALVALGPLMRNRWTMPGPLETMTETQKQAASRAVAAGCRDVGVRLLAALEGPGWEPSARLETLRGLWPQAETAHPAIRFRLAAFLVEEQARSRTGKGRKPPGDTVDAATAAGAALSALLECHGKDPAYAELLGRDVAWALSGPPDEGLTDAIERALERPGIDPWLEQVGRGIIAMQRGRQAGRATYRGASRAAWAFRAYRHLVAAVRLAPDRIEPANTLILTASWANLRGDVISRFWFDTTIRMRYDHHDAYARLNATFRTCAAALEMASAWADGDPATQVPTYALGALERAARTRDAGDQWRTPTWWNVVDRVSTAALTGATPDQEVRIRHQRLSFAMAHGKDDVVAAERAALGARFSANRLSNIPGVTRPGTTAPPPVDEAPPPSVGPQDF